MKPQEAINHACIAKNSEISRSGFSPLQLVMGQNSSFPGLAEVTPASNNVDHSSKAMGALKRIDEARINFRKIDCSEKLKKVRGLKINPAVERSYEMGESVFFRDDKKKEGRDSGSIKLFCSQH